MDALEHVFQPGFKYSKAEVLLLDLRQPSEFLDDLFAVNQPLEASRVMAVLDKINGRWGRGTLRAASVPRNPDWGMRREMMSRTKRRRCSNCGRCLLGRGVMEGCQVLIDRAF